MSSGTARVAALQLVAVRGDKAANLEALETLGAQAAAAGAQVAVAPEMALTGYCWPDEAEIRPLAEPLDGPAVARLTVLARRTGTWFVVGLPELDDDGLLHNVAVLVGPAGLLGVYRKTHPFLADPFWAVDGDAAPPVWSTPAGQVVPLVCADLDYPEPMRYASLAGADWLALPTAWVDEPGPSATWRLRAWENALPVVAADMAGEELGIQFSGGSAVLDHEGHVLAALDAGDGVVVADIDLAVGASRRADVLARRRPAEYGPLALSTRWSRGAAGVFSPTYVEDQVTVAVLDGAPGNLPDTDSRLGLAVAPAFHLCGGTPVDRAAAERAARHWATALAQLAEWAGRHDCEVVTSLVEEVAGDLFVTVVAVDAGGVTGTRRTTHLGRHSSWATPGEALAPRPFERPWGRLGLLGGDELEAFEPSRALAVRGADVLAVPASLSWPWPVEFGGTSVPLGPELEAPDPTFAHPARLRAGDSHVWLALADAGAGSCGGVFAPDHVTVPRVEVLASKGSWVTATCRTRGRSGMGEVCAAKPQLARRRTDLFGRAMVT